MMSSIPDWKCIYNKDLLITLESGSIFINEHCTPAIEITKNSPNATMHMSLKFDSIAEFKHFLKELENKIPLLQAEFNQARKEHLDLNPEKKKKTW